eukprot:3020508-Prymnesium_polylepis.1
MTAALTPPPAYDGRASPCTQVTHHCVTQPSLNTWNREPHNSPLTPGETSASTTSAHDITSKLNMANYSGRAPPWGKWPAPTAQ